MTRSHFAIALAVTLIAGGLFLLGRSDESAGDTAASKPVSADAPRASPSDEPTDQREATPAETVFVNRYRLAFRHSVRLQGREVDGAKVEATVTLEPLRQPGTLAIRVSEASVTGGKRAPSAEQLEADYVVGSIGGRLNQIGFATGTADEAKDLLTMIATGVWYADGEGSEWSRIEEDLLGRFEATYERKDHSVTRKRQLLAMRDGEKLEPVGDKEEIVLDGATRYQLDDEGLVSIAGKELIFVTLGAAHGIESETEVELTRLDSTPTEPRFAALELAPLRSYKTAENVSFDQSLIAGWTPTTLIAELKKLADLDKDTEQEKRFRGGMLARLAAMAREQPASVGHIAGAIRASSGEDPREVSVLAGALGAAGTEAATQALTELMKADLTKHGRLNVAASLGLSKAPTAESIAALADALDDPEIGRTSALALGSQIKNGGGAETADDAMETLLNAYEAADPLSKRALLNALGNTGDRRALPAIQSAIQSKDAVLITTGIYALRFTPGADVDKLLSGLVSNAQLPGVMRIQAVRAVEYRPPGDWRSLLESVAGNGATPADVQAAIKSVLASWS